MPTWTDGAQAKVATLRAEALTAAEPEAAALWERVLHLLAPESLSEHDWLREQLVGLYQAAERLGLTEAATFIMTQALGALHRGEVRAKRQRRDRPRRVQCRMVGASGQTGGTLTLELSPELAAQVDAQIAQGTTARVAAQQERPEKCR